MLSLLVVALYGMGICLTYGWAAEWTLLRISGRDASSDYPLSLSVLLGMALLSGLLAIWSFYWGISTRALVFFTAVAVALAVAMRRFVLRRLLALQQARLRSHLVPLAICGAFSIYALYIAAAGSPTYDVGLYHAQSIRWIEYYPVVPGLANLHSRLGFNSALFLLAAYWGFVALGQHLYQVPGLIIMICTACYCLHLVIAPATPFRFATFVAAGFLLYVLLRPAFLIWIASPATDVPSADVMWVVFLMVARRIELGWLPDAGWEVITILVLSLFAASIKLSAAPVLLLSLFALWRTRSSLTAGRWAAAGVLAALVVLPWLARNITLTGYLLYPFDRLAISSLPWTVPAVNVEQLSLLITAYARNPGQLVGVTAAQAISQWLPAWFRSLDLADRLLVDGACLLPLWLVISAIARKEVAGLIRLYVPMYVANALGITFWFVQAPTPRFGYGVLVPAFLLGPVALLGSLAGWRRLTDRWLQTGSQALVAAALLVNIVQVSPRSWAHYARLIRPYPVAETRTVELDGHAIQMPLAGDQCWYRAFPCTPELQPGLAFRGDRIEDGFYIRGQ